MTSPLLFLDFQDFLLFRLLHGMDEFLSPRLQHLTAGQRHRGGDRRAGDPEEEGGWGSYSYCLRVEGRLGSFSSVRAAVKQANNNGDVAHGAFLVHTSPMKLATRRQSLRLGLCPLRKAVKSEEWLQIQAS